MTPRRTIAILGPLLGLGVAGGTIASCSCWTLDIPAAAAFVSRGLEASFGVALTADQPTEFSLLPLPRLGFRNVRLSAGTSDGPVLAEGGSLAIQLDLTALLLGRAEVVSIAIDGTTVSLPRGDDDARWAGPIARLGAQLSVAGTSHPRRIAASRLTLLSSVNDDTKPTARDVELALSWPFWTETAELAGRLTWRDQAVRFAASDLRPAALAGGVQSPFKVQVTWDGGSLAVGGNATLRGDKSVSGDAVLATTSLPETLSWLRADMALAPLVDDLALQARFEARSDGIAVPSLTIRTGSTALDGAASVELSGRRPSIRATLDADELNLGPLLARTLRIAGFEDEGWGRRSLDLKPLTGGDLDLRLSSTGARLGPLGFGSLAASVMVRADSIEATLNRANFEGGTLKGHLNLSALDENGEGTTRVGASGRFEGLDMAAALVALGQPGCILGAASGDFVLSGAGRDAESLVQDIGGRATLGIGNGAIAGLDLADVVARKGMLAHGALARRNGRTPFEKASVILNISRGDGDIAEGLLIGRSVNAALTGRVSLIDRQIAARATLAPKTPVSESKTPAAEATTAATEFMIAGPWSTVTVTGPGQRSGQVAGPFSASAQPPLPPETRAYAP